MQEPFVDVVDLAQFLKVKKQTAYHIVATLNIPHYRVGRLIRFKLSEIEEWMNKNKAKLLNVPYGKLDNI
ncbi:MAG: helix-turn-helix domain-containing protein [Thermodesulfobacteriota bacterium]